jgi:hypothetical protein
MSYSLTKLNSCYTVAILHRDAPQDICEVELDLKVSMVRNWDAAEYSRVACAVYVPCAGSLLSCC